MNCRATKLCAYTGPILLHDVEYLNRCSFFTPKSEKVIWYSTSGELLPCLTSLKPTTVPVTCLYLFYIRPGSVNVTYTITSTSEITEEEVQEFIDKNLLYNCKITDTDVEYQLVLTCESESNSFVRSRESRKLTDL